MKSSIPRFTFGLALVLVFGGLGVLLFAQGKVQTVKDRNEAITPTAAQTASAEQWRDIELGGMICMMIGAGLATVSTFLPRLLKRDIAVTSSLLLMAFMIDPAFAADDLVNLLSLPHAKVEQISSPQVKLGQLTALRDDNLSTIVEFPVRSSAPLEITFGFGGETVTAESFAVQLSQDAAKMRGIKIEILASDLSPVTGFRSIRTDLLESTSDRQEFRFQPTGAKWIMLRLLSDGDNESMPIAEWAILGRTGPPATVYAFGESPSDALEVLDRLKEFITVEVADDESSLFEDARDGVLDQWSFAEAVLIASGITNRSQRQTQLAKLKSLEVEARLALKGVKDPFERGKSLLAWLHAKPMVNGYISNQTDLSVVLDTATFNCVSSAALFNVLGRRLGLDLRAIEVPDHAFSVLYDGIEHVDVETTTVDGFDPARDPAALQQFTQTTGFNYIPDRHRDQRREIQELGLAAIIYYNHGVERAEQQQYADALIYYFRALNLDPEFDSAVKNVLSAFANWGIRLSDAGRFEEALRIINTGIDLAADDATLLHNRKVVWSDWASSAIDAGDEAGALTILRQAQENVPAANFQQMEAWVYIRPGEALVQAGRWEDAMAISERGLAAINEEAQADLRDWKVGLFIRWSNSELEQLRFESAAQVLGRGIAATPNDRRLSNNLGFVAQEWSSSVYREKGAVEAEATLASLIQDHPGISDINDVADNYIGRLVNDLTQAGQFEQALSAIERNKPRIKSDARELELRHFVFDQWAEDRVRNGNWEEALEVYNEGMKKHPGDRHFSNNSTAIWDQWAQTYVAAADWSRAAGVYAKALEQHSENRHFESNLGFVVQEWSQSAYRDHGAAEAELILDRLIKQHPNISAVRDSAKLYVQQLVMDLVGEQEFDSALKAVSRNTKLFNNDRDPRDLVRRIFDQWAGPYMQSQRWQEALDVYAEARERYPDERHFRSNAIAIWDQWARTFFATQDWDRAIDIYGQALLQFPNEGLLKNNLEYCKQQRDK